MASCPQQASAPTHCPGRFGSGAHLCDSLWYSAAGALPEGGQARLLPLLQRGVQRLQLALVPAAQIIACLSGRHSARPSTGFRRRLTAVSGEEALVRRQREHQAGNKAPLITGRFQAGQRLWTGSLLLLKLTTGHLVAVSDEVVGLGEGLPVNDKLARDLVALQRLVPRHVVYLCAYPGPELCFIHCSVCLCTQQCQGLPRISSLNLPQSKNAWAA